MFNYGGLMRRRRISNWTIRNSISDTEEIWLHGYTGAVDIIDKSIIENPDEDVQQKMLDSGYLTEMDEVEEQFHFELLCKDIRKVILRSMIYVLQFSFECNFSCSYCFEHNSRRSSKSRHLKIESKYLVRVREVINSLRKEKIIDDEELVFFGGEPLLPENKSLLQDAVFMAEELNIKKIKVITNGFYVDSMIGVFEQNTTRFQITLDGTQEVHDKRRFDKNTKKSFERILENIEMLVKLGYVVQLRVNIDHNNYEQIPFLFEIFLSKGLSGYEQFQPYLAYIQDYGKYEQLITPSQIISYYESQSIFKDFKVALDPLGLQRMLHDSVVNGKLFEFTINHCGANKGTMITLSPDGRIYPCWDSNEFDVPIGTYYPEVSWDLKYYKKNWVPRCFKWVTG